ncbi:hypothetical protein [Salisediminibacterium halotolerans]|uniref:hypothetical protein n=1 Tax=Salisediminibacterium halotolerans TaxID=517425 RepID=UPI000EB51FAD|nr:hypothetical protein [Salisediminibacterium halotolerans]RLJ78085.1 hypothetical protein BCL39_0551 [Actinophytocola xinjiangensis]RPE88577.1 hypothetical protein EDD67_0908 [Salisediminibacterium halotolerans]TWG37062.1 hypothetical protein BCL52_0550 [Salisediminibacterium halotolerans]GEL06916.1 hypothetical protein SHA02_03320 [Salisediminibacterium halotolerans]
MQETASPFLSLALWSEWLFVFFLLIAGGIFWLRHKRTGFMILYLTVLSLSVSFIITLYFPYLYTEDMPVPITHPHIQATMTLTAFLIPLAKKRMTVLVLLVPITAMSFIYLLLHQIPALSIVGGILIGGFISYSYYRSQDWMGAMPEPFLFLFAAVLPMFIAVLVYPQTPFLYLAGVLFGTGVGAAYEQLKVRMIYEGTLLRNRVQAMVIGSFGIISGYLLYTLGLFNSPFLNFSFGLLTGLWITFIVPLLLVSLGFFSKEGAEERVF